MDTFNDKSLNCADCGQEFIFSRNEQAFYAERGFTNEPKRCKNCRDKRKTARDGNGGGEGRHHGLDATTRHVARSVGRRRSASWTTTAHAPIDGR